MRYWAKQNKKIRGQPLLSMTIASYLNEDPRRLDALTCLLYSFKAQTYAKWTATVVHDGPCQNGFNLSAYLKQAIGDKRISVVTTPERLMHHGHPYRREQALLTQGDYLGFTNDDNYYAPVYFEWMLSELTAGADFVYCDMVHSHKLWQPFKTEPRYKKLDMGGFVASRQLVELTPWTDFSFKGDGTFIDALQVRARKVVKVPATLFVHN
jgi:hypothetical protein